MKPEKKIPPWKKISFRGGRNEMTHCITVNLVWFQKINECANISFWMISRKWLITWHKFKYNFQNCLIPLCGCVSIIESTSGFLIRCTIFNTDLTKPRWWIQRRRRTIVLNKCTGTLWESSEFFVAKGTLPTQNQFVASSEKDVK